MNNWLIRIICKIPILRRQCELWYNSKEEEIAQLDKDLDSLELHIMRIQLDKQVRRGRKGGEYKPDN